METPPKLTHQDTSSHPINLQTIETSRISQLHAQHIRIILCFLCLFKQSTLFSQTNSWCWWTYAWNKYQHKFKVTIGPPIPAIKLKQSKIVHNFYKNNKKNLKIAAKQKVKYTERPNPFLEIGKKFFKKLFNSTPKLRWPKKHNGEANLFI